MTQEQRDKAFAVAESLPRLDAFIRVRGDGSYLSPSNAPALASEWSDSLVFEWNENSYDDEGRRGCYTLLAGAK